MTYITTRAIEPMQNTYRMSQYRYMDITPRPQGYTRQFLRYERAPTARTIRASYFVDNVEKQAQRLARKKAKDSYLSLTAAIEMFTGKKYTDEADDWARFFISL